MGLDMPVESTVAVKYLASKASELTASLQLGPTAHFKMRADHMYDKQTKIAMVQEYNQHWKVPYNVGFDLTYTL